MKALTQSKADLQKYTLKCDNCGKIFKRRQRVNQLEYKHCFCNKKCETEYRTKKIEVKCANCGNIFMLPPNRLKNRTNLYCSRKCMTEGFKNRIVKKCRICGKRFETLPSRIKVQKEVFCSMRCRKIALRKDGKIKTFKELPYEWGYLMGVLCSDGHLSNSKTKYGFDRAIRLLCKEDGFANLFKGVLEKITDMPCRIKKRKNRKSILNSIEFYHYSLWKELKKKGVYGCQTWRVPKIVLVGQKDIKIGFLQGFFDGDGGICQGRNGRLFPTLVFNSTNLAGLVSIGEVLTWFDIEFTINCTKRQHEGWSDIYRLNILRKADVILYSELIGFGKKEHQGKFDKCCSQYLSKVKYQNLDNQKGVRIGFKQR